MEIIKTSTTINTGATTAIEGINYVLNYSEQDAKLISLNGQFSKGNVNLGTFNMNDQTNIASNVNFNFNINAALADKQAIVADISAIYDKISAEIAA